MKLNRRRNNQKRIKHYHENEILYNKKGDNKEHLLNVLEQFEKMWFIASLKRKISCIKPTIFEKREKDIYDCVSFLTDKIRFLSQYI